MRNTIKKTNLNQKGITLIALVITVIVLLILAGITISMLSGENGTLKQAVNAKEQVEIAQIIEETQIAVLASYETNGKISFEKLKENLKLINNVNEVTIPEKQNDGIKNPIFPLFFSIGKYKVQIIDEQRVSILPDGYELYKNINIEGYTNANNKYAYFNTGYIPSEDTALEMIASRAISTRAHSGMVGTASQIEGDEMDFVLGIFYDNIRNCPWLLLWGWRYYWQIS